MAGLIVTLAVVGLLLTTPLFAHDSRDGENFKPWRLPRTVSKCEQSKSAAGKDRTGPCQADLGDGVLALGIKELNAFRKH
jgi:hypothetical protein